MNRAKAQSHWALLSFAIAAYNGGDQFVKRAPPIVSQQAVARGIMGRKKQKKEVDDNTLVIKRYGNRRLYNLETASYVNYQDLVKLIRDGHEIQVIDSRTKEDVTKSVLMQIILEEEKNSTNLLPIPFLYQILRSREDEVQDFFKNYLATSFAAYMKTKEEFDKRFKGFLEMSASAPQIWEKFIPGAETVKDLFRTGKKKEEKE
jgi:polyhydroxyalkanoate synthesis repressor PhaR